MGSSTGTRGTTLLGLGFLRAPQAARALGKPVGWPLTRSALRRCMFLPASPDLLAQVPEYIRQSPAAQAHGLDRARTPRPAFRRTPARAMRFDGAEIAEAARVARLAQAAQVAAHRASFDARTSPSAQAVAPWTGPSPLQVGLLLCFAPPVGLALLWASPHFSRDARLALTVMTAVGMTLASLFGLALLALALR